MTTFSKLKFKPHSYTRDCKRAVVFFANGYGASVIHTHAFASSYGSNNGLYEMAVLKGNANNCRICYTTPITDDVIIRLTPRRVTKHLKEIQSLPAPKEAG